MDSGATAMLSQMGPIVNSLSPAARRDILGILQRDEEWKALHSAIAALQEVIKKLEAENLGMAGGLEAAMSLREALHSQVSSPKDAGTARKQDIKSLRLELVEAEHKCDRLAAHSNTERVALQSQISDLETQHRKLKETVAEQETRISKLERQGFSNPSSPTQTEKRAKNRTSRVGSRWGEDRRGGPIGEQQFDGWSVVGGSIPRPPPKAGDLSNFGKINKFGPVVMGPSIVWAGKKDAAKRDSTLTRVNSSSNMFTMLDQDGEAMAGTSSQPSQQPRSTDLNTGGTAEPQRKKLQFLARLKFLEEENKIDGDSPGRSGGGGDDYASRVIFEAEANKRITEDIKEFFSVRNIDKSEEYFTKLPSEYHHRLVDKMVSKAIESKEADGKLVADAFARAAEKNLCSISAFEEGFLPIAELLDDIAIDAPKAFQIMAIMMKGARLDKDEERRTRIAQKSIDSDNLLGLLA